MGRNKVQGKALRCLKACLGSGNGESLLQQRDSALQRLSLPPSYGTANTARVGTLGTLGTQLYTPMGFASPVSPPSPALHSFLQRVEAERLFAEVCDVR